MLNQSTGMSAATLFKHVSPGGCRHRLGTNETNEKKICFRIIFRFLLLVYTYVVPGCRIPEAIYSSYRLYRFDDVRREGYCTFINQGLGCYCSKNFGQKLTGYLEGKAKDYS